MANSVKLERRDSVAIVTLNRPEVLNAVDMEMRETLITLLAELNKAGDVRAVVLTGEGDRAFCSGQDVEEIVRYTVDHIESWVTRQHAMYAAVRDLDKPCIVAFNGVAAGAGLQIALCADLRIGFPEMKLGQPEIKAGLASIVGSYLMTMHLGLSKNVELSLTGDMITGDVAHSIGILNHLVPRGEVMSKSFALAAEMSKLAPTAFRLTKQHFRSLTQAGFAAAMEAGKAAQKEAYASGEPQEAMRKFLEARKPRKS